MAIKIAKVDVLAESGMVRWTFSDGTVRSLGIEEMSPEMQRQAMLHGMKQKGSDCYAGCGGDVEAAIRTQDAVLEGIRSGDWNRSGGSIGGLIYEAIAEATGRTVEEILEKFAEMSSTEREAKLKQLRKHPQVKAIYLRLQAERAEKKAEQYEDLVL